MGFWHWLFTGKRDCDDSNGGTKRQFAERQPIISDPELPTRSSAYGGPTDHECSAACAASGHRSAQYQHSHYSGTQSDVIVACQRCGTSVAVAADQYAATRRDRSEILCPSCAFRGRGAVAYSDPDPQAIVLDSGPSIVPVVDVVSPDPVIFVDTPAVAVSEPCVSPDVVVGDGSSFGGGGAGGDY